MSQPQPPPDEIPIEKLVGDAPNPTESPEALDAMIESAKRLDAYANPDDDGPDFQLVWSPHR
jgi:hypothetical protein